MAASCDTRRAGGIEQLEAFTRILDLPLARIGEAAELATFAAAAAGNVTIIDTAGSCPFSGAEMRALEDLIEAADAEPVLVLAAGGDAAEAGETAAAFARLGCRRMIATRIDVSRRFGGLVAAAAGGRLALAGVGIGPHAAEPPAAVNSLSLAKLFLSAARPATASPSSAPAVAPDSGKARR
jgi:flagellar biosynthesis protein FlhF